MKKVMSTKKAVASKIALGVVAASAAAAGYYFYASKDAKKNRKIAATWATSMKKEVIKEAKKLEEASPKAFAAVVDRVAKTYQAARSVDATEMKRAVKELKENWDMLERETKRTVRKSVSTAKTAAKKTVKKAVKKASARSK